MTMTITSDPQGLDHTFRTNLAMWWAEKVASDFGIILGDECCVLLDTVLESEWLFRDYGRTVCRVTYSSLDDTAKEYEWMFMMPTDERGVWNILRRTVNGKQVLDREGKPILAGREVQWTDGWITYCLMCDHNPCECRS